MLKFNEQFSIRRQGGEKKGAGGGGEKGRDFALMLTLERKMRAVLLFHYTEEMHIMMHI